MTCGRPEQDRSLEEKTQEFNNEDKGIRYFKLNHTSKVLLLAKGSTTGTTSCTSD